jgi:hypothetical protein
MSRIALRSLASLALLVAAEARAVTLNWNNAAGGSAAIGANWSPIQIPTASDALIFNLAGTYAVSFNSTVGQTQSHTYRNGTVSLTFNNPHVATSGLLFGSMAGDMPRVTVTTGVLQADKGLTIGAPSSGDARLSVQGSGTLVQGFSSGYDFIVGGNSAGTLNVQTGAIVRSADDLFIGFNSTGNGVVNVSGVSGNASTLSTHGANGDIVVGQNGTGLLAVSSGGDVQIQQTLEVAQFSGSNGTVNVSNAGSKILAPHRLNLSSNETTGAAGTASMTVSGGLVTVGNRTKIGDANGGSGVLHVTGGTFETDSLVVDPTHGTLDLQSGILRIARGVGDLANAPFTFAGGTFMVRDTATVTRTSPFFIGSAGASLKIRKRGTFTCTSNLFMTSGTPSIDVDSSATLNVTGRLNLVAGGVGSLHLGHGSTATVGSFETADESGNAQMTIESPMGTTSTLTYQGTSYIGGDETDHASGGTTVFVQSGGEMRHSGAGTTLWVLGPGNLIVTSGGLLTAGDSIYVKGLMQVYGTIASPVMRFLGNGRLQGSGAVPCDLSSAVTTTSINAFGNIALGRATTGGWQFGGSLFCNQYAVSILDTNGFTFGDTTSIAGGSLTWSSTAIVPAAGAFIGRGTANGILANGGTLSIEGPNPATLTINGNYVAGAGSKIALRLNGRNAGQADRVQVTGSLNCAQTLDLTFAPGAVFQAGDVITILTGGTRSGTFSTIVTHGLSGGMGVMQVEYTATAVNVHFLQTVDVPAAAPAPLALVGRSFTAGGAGAAFELTLPERAFVTLEVFDARGRRVAVLDAKDEDAGVHRFPLSVAGTTPWRRGVYFGRVRVATAGAPPRALSAKLVVR